MKLPREQGKTQMWRGTRSRPETYHAGVAPVEHVKSGTSRDVDQEGDAVEMRQRIRDAILGNTSSIDAESVMKQLLEVTPLLNDGPEDYGHQVIFP